MDQNDDVIKSGEEAGQEETVNKMEALLALEGITIDFPKRGEIRKGTIASVNPTQVLVGVGAKSEGILAGKELDSIDQETRESFKVGDEVVVYVVNPEDANGNLILSYTRALEEENWQTAEELLESESSFHSTIVGFNKGGLLVPLETIRGFVPASQISLGRRLTITGNSPEERYADMVGEEIEVAVIEVDRDRRRLILSERAASSETRDSIKERVIEELEEGEVRTGRVTSLADFGAFVNISGADGLVHLSEISWDHVNHPSEILEVGQGINVKVISVDVERKRIGLSIRRLQDDPWSEQVAKLTEGQLVEGRITRLTNFGAFARLLVEDIEGELEGLIHISEISERRIEHPKEVLHEGEVVTLRIIKIEEDSHRIGLSLRRVDSPAYSDLDWKTLTNEFDVEELKDGFTDEEVEESEAVSEDAVTDEAPEVETESAEEPVEEAAEEEPADEATEGEEKALEETVDDEVEAEEETVEGEEAVEEEAVEEVAEVEAVVEETPAEETSETAHSDDEVETPEPEDEEVSEADEPQAEQAEEED
ncbi:MAG: 30S ribosomal protein S1 [Brevefilum sp.]|jgi:small subunit ribosomal protein S1